jgi:predicted nucleic acid-binding protein
MFLLDTNVVSEVYKGNRHTADPRVLAWEKSVALDELFLSVVTLFELEAGVLRMERRDAFEGARLRALLNLRIVPGFADRILYVDTRVAQRCAHLHVPDPAPFRDSLIAATALVHGLTVVTRNVRDFEPTGVRIVNPWSV